MAKIVLIASYSASIINFRGDMIRDWIKKGHTVLACAPETGFEKKIEEVGATFIPVRLQRAGMNPLEDCIYLFDLIRLLKKIKPDIVFSYTIKPVIYGSLAASFCSVPKIFSMITGAGFALQEGKNPLFQHMFFTLYRKALAKNTAIFFQNPDDKAQFRELDLTGMHQNIQLINGSGVNLEQFPHSEAPVSPIRFLLMARLIPQKGIYEYVAAAKEIKKTSKEVIFSILGHIEDRPGSIKRQEVEEWKREGIIEYLGTTENVRPFLKKTSVFVLPSYYREGVPRSILEALATGRPIITTDTPGCRETVVNGTNGFLIPPKDTKSLADAMCFFILRKAEIKRMGYESFLLAKDRFDVKIVNSIIAKTMCI